MEILKQLRKSKHFLVGVLVVLCFYGAILIIKRVVSKPHSATAQTPRIEFDRFRLANGLQVVTHRDANAPLAAIEVWYHAGSKDDPAGRSGLGHVVEHLLFSSTTNIRSDFLTEMEQLGAWDYNGLTNRDRMRFFMSVPSSSLNAALWLESERMGHVEAITEELVKEAKQTVLNEIRRNESDSAVAVEMLLAKAAFENDHPYSHLPAGEIGEIETITLADVKQWLRTYYTPSNATLVIAGDIDPVAVRSSVETYFGYIKGGDMLPRWTSWIAQSNSSRHYTIKASVSAPQVGMIWAVPGYGTPEADYLDLARHTLESRLMRGLVNDDAVADSIKIDFQSHELCGLFILTITRWAGMAGPQALAEAERQIEILREQGPEPDELEAAKSQVANVLLYQSEQVGGLSGKAAMLAISQVIAGDADHINRSMARSQSASTKDVRDAVSAWISPGTAMRFSILPTEEGPAHGGERPQSMPPIEGNDRTSFPAIEQMELPNGLKILMAHRLGTVAGVKLIWPAPMGSRQSEEPMFRLTHSLLSQGSSEAVFAKVEKKLKDLGARFIIDSTGAHSGIGLDFPAGKLVEALEIISAMVTNASFDEDRVMRAKQQLKRKVAERTQGSSRRAALSVLRQLLYYEADMLRRGAENVQAATSSQVEYCYKKWFGPDSATLVIAGNTDLNSLGPILHRLFGDWRAFENATAENPASDEAGRPDIYVVDRPGAEHAVIAGALAVPSETIIDRHALGLVANILSFKVSRSVRVEKQLSYEANASYEQLSRGNALIVWGDAHRDKVPDLLRALRGELLSLNHGKPYGEMEFKTAQSAMLRRTRQLQETAGSLINAIAENALANLSDKVWTGELPEISYDQSLHYASLLGKPERYVWVITGDSSVIASHIQHLGYRVQILPPELWAFY
jgi:zinc protease